MDIERDVSLEIKNTNHKANPFGWSCSQLYHGNKQIGTIYCGDIKIDAEGYRHEIVPEHDHKRLKVYCTKDEDAWKAEDFAKEFKTSPT